MTRKLLLLFSLIIISTSIFAQTPKYKLVFEDNFKGKKINDKNWSKIPRGGSDWNNYMSSNPSLYQVKNNTLTLYGRENKGIEPNDTAQYITGGVYTKGKRSIVYGKVEVRAKFSSAQGMWPAIWMLPEGEKWPFGGEIDIMEHLNFDKFVYQTIHTNYTYNLNQKENPVSHGVAPINPDDYNVYAVELLPEKIVFYVNNVETFAYPRVKEFEAEQQYPFGKEPFYLLIDMQIGGSWVGQPKPEQYTSWMDIDSVKMYELID